MSTECLIRQNGWREIADGLNSTTTGAGRAMYYVTDLYIAVLHTELEWGRFSAYSGPGTEAISLQTDLSHKGLGKPLIAV